MQKNQIIQVQNANIYQGDTLILQGVDFALGEGEFCYLIGKTGSGKSSFLKTIYAASKLREGKGQVVEQDLMSLTPIQLPYFRRKLGMIFQDFKLFEEWTVRQNLMYVLQATEWKDKTKINQRIEEVLHDVSMQTKEETLVSHLSGGEQQRLAIARAILNQPELLIADEPTGNLDPESSDDILYLLKKLTTSNKMATIFATHDYRLLEKFPARVYRCNERTITEVF